VWCGCTATVHQFAMRDCPGFGCSGFRNRLPGGAGAVGAEVELLCRALPLEHDLSDLLGDLLDVEVGSVYGNLVCE